MKPFAALCLIALAAACSPQPAAEATPTAQTAAAAETAPARHPQSGLAVIPLTVTTAGGKQHQFRVEVAASAAEQQQGMMFRTAMGPDEGMIFPNRVPQMRSFWMKNTVIPLDIIFIGPDRRILNIAANAVPYSLDSVPSAGPVINVLEIAGGRAQALGLKAGDAVAW